jgi:hypothetical protein
MNDLEEMLSDFADLAKKVSSSDYQWGMNKLLAFKRLVLSQLPFGEGDRVAIADSWRGPERGGWWPHREWMRPGQTGTVREIDIYPDSLRLRAVTKFDTEWELSDWPADNGRRFNRLFDYDGVTPRDRRHVFHFQVEHLRAATAADKPFGCPVDASWAVSS